MSLTDKNILIISPQSWGKMHISKHHYAIELANRGNRVYFLNPPDYSQKQYLVIKRVSGISNLITLTYKPFVPSFLRFHFRGIFDFLMYFELHRLRKTVNRSFDILWDFEMMIYSNLKWFGARTIILHPVDLFAPSFDNKVGNQANVIFSVSKNILDKFSSCSAPKIWINHGLSNKFAQMASKMLTAKYFRNDSDIRVGYVGNLFNAFVDRDMILEVVSGFKHINFFFVGPSTVESGNLGGDSQATDFVLKLSRCENVRLMGVMNTAELVNFLPSLDAFIMCYKQKANAYDQSNSHKVLEYLSTGKVIVSSYLSVYREHRNLIQMVDENKEDSDYVRLFDETMKNIESHNSDSLRQKRILLALDNTYIRQIERIEKFVQ